jgi:histidinol-phosphate aminotransferase
MKLISSRVRDFLKSEISYPLAREYDVRAPEAVNLASNESPYGPSPKAVRALRKEIEFVRAYPDPKAMRLKRVIGRYVGVRAGGVVIGNGSDELMDLTCKAFLDPGDRVFVPIPSFSMYELACRTNGGVPIFYKLPNFEWRADELARAARGTKIAFVGRPNNPTGNMPSNGALSALASTAKLVVIDEAYVEFAQASVVKDVKRMKNVLVLRTFSKAFGLAGLRIGYAVGNPELIRVLERIRAPFNVNRIAQTAALAVLEDLRYMKRTVKKIKIERERLRRDLSGLELRVFPSEANFLMVDVGTWGLSAPEFCDHLAKEKIFVRDLSGFRGAGSSFVRITVGKPRENEKLLNAIKRMRRRCLK